MIRVLSLFSGIGAFEKALGNKGINFELINYCEKDKYASRSYSVIHDVPESMNLGDVTKVDAYALRDFDLTTWGFPCQDISVAGHQQGMAGATRSGLYREGMRILEAKRPRVSIFENVKNLVGKKFKTEFETILKDLEELGYTNYWKVLNAKDYGIPQNRERVFCVSVLGEHKPVKWPEPSDNGIRLRDLLEEEVDEKYYINTERAQKLLESLDWENVAKKTCDMTTKDPKFKDVGNCIKARYDAGVVDRKSEGIGVVVPVLTPDRAEKRQNGRRFKTDGEPMFTLTGQDRHGILQVGNMVDTPNRDDPQRGRVYSKEGISPAMHAGARDKIAKVIIDDTYGSNVKVANNYRIRKLTPLECWRLMGFDDKDCYRAELIAGISNTQLYKQAGNSIVVQVLEGILGELYGI